MPSDTRAVREVLRTDTATVAAPGIDLIAPADRPPTIVDLIKPHARVRAGVLAAIERFGAHVFFPIVSQPHPLTNVTELLQSHGPTCSIGMEERVETIVPVFETLSSAVPASVPAAFYTATARYAMLSVSPGTLRKRKASWIRIVDLCLQVDREPLPMLPATAAGVIATIADKATSFATVRAALDTITFVHRLAQCPDPTRDLTVRRVVRGIRNVLGTDSPHAKIALVRADVDAMIALAADAATLQSLGDALVMLLTYEFALRRCEAVSVWIEHVTFVDGKIGLWIPRSKSNLRGETIWAPDTGAPHGLGNLLRRWLQLRGASEPLAAGPLLCSVIGKDSFSRRPICERTVARIVQRYAQSIGIDVSQVGAHSLRAGWATQALHDGVPEAQVAAHLRHSSLTTLLRYYRPRPHMRRNLSAAVIDRTALDLVGRPGRRAVRW
jgi:integrase